MRYGLMEAFEKLLDKNLSISDDKVVITRKKYWEERGRHNDDIEVWKCIIPEEVQSNDNSRNEKLSIINYLYH